MLKIEHLTKIYGDKKAVDDLSLHIRPAESQRQTTFAPVREQAPAPDKADSPLITGSLGLLFLFFLLQHLQMFFHRFQSAFILGDLIDFIKPMFQSADLLNFSLQCGQHHFGQLTFAD